MPSGIYIISGVNHVVWPNMSEVALDIVFPIF